MAVLRRLAGEADGDRLLRAHSSSGQDQFERPAVADDARQTDRAEIDERHAEAAIEEAESGRARRYPRSHHKASSNPPATAAPSIAAITGLLSLSRDGPIGPKSPSRSTGRTSPSCERLEVGAGAEGAARPGQDRDVEILVRVEPPEGVVERPRGREIDGVAPLGPLDRHHGHPALGADG